MATNLPTTTPAPAAVPGTLTLNGMTAVPNATTTPAQVAAATAAGWTPANPAPGSTVAALSTVPNSPAGSPAGSSTGQQNLAAQTAINGTTTARALAKYEITSGAINGVNTSFTFAAKPTVIVSDGITLQENNGWTWSVNTATLTGPGPTFDIYGLD